MNTQLAHIQTAMFLLVLPILSACGTLGAPGCTPDPAVPPQIASAQKASCGGNRSASMTVGDYYSAEAERTGDDKLYRTAARFYGRAAQTRSGQTFIYVPGAGKVPGYTMPVTTGPTSYGLPQARAKLALLHYKGLGFKQNTEKACKLLGATSYAIAGAERMITACLERSVQKMESEAG